MAAAEKKVLIVDDQPSSRALLHAVLEDGGFQIFDAEDGKAALAAARNLQPDLVIMDIMMPGMTGLEALEQMRADPKLKHIPVILCTAQSKMSDVERGLAAGASDYVVKPIDTHKLLVKVARQLGVQLP